MALHILGVRLRVNREVISWHSSPQQCYLNLNRSPHSIFEGVSAGQVCNKKLVKNLPSKVCTYRTLDVHMAVNQTVI